MRTSIFKIFKIAIVLIFFMTGNYIYAATDNNQKGYTCNLTFTPDKTVVKPGESITYDMKVSNINAGNGIVIADFYVSYDSELFDCKVRSYDEDKWLINGAINGKYTMSTYGAQPTKEDQVIAKIILTPKTGVTNNTYPIKITNITFTTDEKDDGKITLTDATLNIIVTSPQSTSGETSGDSTSGTGTSEAGETSKDTKGNTATDETAKESKTSSEEKSDTTKTTKKASGDSKSLPYSGDKETLLIISGIAILISSSIWFFVRYKKINI